MRILIVNYGMGNINSIIGALNYLGYYDIVYSNDEKDIISSDKIILPGVGAFNKAMDQINKRNLKKILEKQIIKESKPILGICLGMQLMTMQSNENVFKKGLEFVDADVEKFKDNSFKIPHVGFNQVKKPKKSYLFKDINDDSDFYFCHSYCANTKAKINQSYCEYGESFISSFEVDNIAGVQFHPELSQFNGLKLLENFINYF